MLKSCSQCISLMFASGFSLHLRIHFLIHIWPTVEHLFCKLLYFCCTSTWRNQRKCNKHVYLQTTECFNWLELMGDSRELVAGREDRVPRELVRQISVGLAWNRYPRDTWSNSGLEQVSRWDYGQGNRRKQKYKYKEKNCVKKQHLKLDLRIECCHEINSKWADEKPSFANCTF